MGGCGTKTNEHEVTVPQNQRQQIINQQFSQFLRLDHPLNVNHKYSSFFKVIPEQFVGQGIRKTNSYESRLSKGEWIAKREEFWETRIEGRPECWQAIKGACETDDQNAIAILAAGELKLVNKTIQILYDGQGHKYDVPIFCINEPVRFPEQPSSEAGLNQNIGEQSIQVVIRATKFPQDLKLSITTTTAISDIKVQLMEKAKDMNVKTIRLFYNGREMLDHHLVGNYNITNSTVLQAFCT